MNVFKKSLFWLLLFVGSYSCFAQELSIRGGLNLSKVLQIVDGKDITDDSKLKPGFHFGPILNMGISNTFSFETGLLYSVKGLISKGQHGENRTYLSKFNIAYLDIPLKLKAVFPLKHFMIFGTGGGYVASGLYGSLIERADLSNNQGVWEKLQWNGNGTSIKRIDYGLDLGCGIKHKTKEFGINYQIGIHDLNNSGTNIAGFNRNLEFYVSHEF